MTLTRSKTELQGKLSEVMGEIDLSYPSVAVMLQELTACMILCGSSRVEFSPDNYSKIGDVEVKLSIEGEKVFIELLGGKDE